MPESQKHWEAKTQVAEQKLKDLFPMLANPPKHVQEYDAVHTRKQTHTPFRLFRNIVSPTLTTRKQHDIVILGTLLNTAVPTYADISSLWGVVYLENLPFSPYATAELNNLEAMEKEVSLFNAWGWVRYRDRSISYLDGSVEIQDFMDQFVRDLGLESARKKRAQRMRRHQVLGVRGWVKEYIEKWGLRRRGRKRWNLVKLDVLLDWSWRIRLSSRAYPGVGQKEDILHLKLSLQSSRFSQFTMCISTTEDSTYESYYIYNPQNRVKNNEGVTGSVCTINSNNETNRVNTDEISRSFSRNKNHLRSHNKRIVPNNPE
jgi:hypothetical protein